MKIKMFAAFAGIALLTAGCINTTCGTKTAAVNASPLTPKKAVRQMSRGINLGNTLEPPTKGAWNNGQAQEYYFDDYKAAGFKFVRIPVRWDEHTGTNAPYTIDEAWLQRVQQVVDWGMARGLFIILNAHHENWLTTNYDGAVARERFDRIWTQISERFKGEPDHLLFEILNEPHGMTPDQVDIMNARILKIIRASNPTRLVLFTGNDWSQPERLIAATVPEDSYVIGTFHMYFPHSFACDGQGTCGSKADRKALHQKFEKVSAWSAAHGVPALLGEFGAVSDCDPASRHAMYTAYVREALQCGFPFAVWDDGGKYQVYLRDTRGWNELKDIVITTKSRWFF